MVRKAPWRSIKLSQSMFRLDNIAILAGIPVLIFQAPIFSLAESRSVKLTHGGSGGVTSRRAGDGAVSALPTTLQGDRAALSTDS